MSNYPGLIDCPPQPVLHAGDRQHDFVHVPFVAGRRQPAPDLVGERLPELQHPLPDGPMADDDAARSQQFVHHAQAEREAEVEPCGVADEPQPGSGSRRSWARRTLSSRPATWLSSISQAGLPPS